MGGGCAATDSAQVATASGGSAGAYARGRYTAAQIGTSVPITIGAKGTGGAAGNNSGIDGGNTVIGTLMTCPGGPGGSGSSAVSNSFPAATRPTARSSVSTGGNIINSAGEGGQAGIYCGSVISGCGGTPPFGSGGSSAQNQAGNVGTGYGAGGGGASSLSNVAGRPGGDGTAGVAIIFEYA